MQDEIMGMSDSGTIDDLGWHFGFSSTRVQRGCIIDLLITLLGLTTDDSFEVLATYKLYSNRAISYSLKFDRYPEASIIIS